MDTAISGPNTSGLASPWRSSTALNSMPSFAPSTRSRSWPIWRLSASALETPRSVRGSFSGSEKRCQIRRRPNCYRSINVIVPRCAPICRPFTFWRRPRERPRSGDRWPFAIWKSPERRLQYWRGRSKTLQVVQSFAPMQAQDCLREKTGA
jgi:hypothetical protein